MWTSSAAPWMTPEKRVRPLQAASQEELGDGQKHRLQNGDIAAHSPNEVLMAGEALDDSRGAQSFVSFPRRL